MQALKDLFTTDVGLLSLAVILFMLGMAVFYLRFFIRQIREDEAHVRLTEGFDPEPASAPQGKSA